MSMSEALLPEFDAEMANTRKMLERVPDDKFAWKPHEKSMTLGRLAGHIAEMPDYIRYTLTLPSMSLTNENGEPNYESFYPKSREELLEKFDTDVAQARAALAKSGDEDLAHQWKMDWQGQTVIDQPRAQVVRIMCLSHVIHHRAQLGVYLRMNDIPIPGMYGPSNDEMPS